MSDVIRLLSDHLANQIAAGEVIQRPASAVKELLENAIDAGATEIQLILRQSGKELIQVIDNGSGMSPTDARMSFERHATSKIRDINDLFRIRTMGFRGEALASVAAVAQVELRTRQEVQPVGTRLVIEGTEVKVQEPTATPVGTNLMVKNLFFNVPARRHFLKSNTTEYRHIIDEFTRVSMAQPQVGFKLYHDDEEKLRLDAGNLKTRIVGLLGNHFEKNLVPVDEPTDVLHIKGFIGKPAAATKSRGNQFFFINGRYIRNAYLHHAVTTAYDGLIEKDSFPFYVLFLEVDPARVDVNVHPTKQEVKFEDDRLMYAYLQAAVRHALARYNIAPSLDFTLNSEIQGLSAVQLPTNKEQDAETERGYLHNTFRQSGQAHRAAPSGELEQWKEVYKRAAIPDAGAPEEPMQQALHLPSNSANEAYNEQPLLSVQGAMLVTTVKSGLMLIHTRRAAERIWYERLQDSAGDHPTPSQQLLFPINVELPPTDALLLSEVLPDLKRMGFDVSPFGASTFAIQGVPSGLPAGEEKAIIEHITDSLKHAAPAPEKRREQLIMALAYRLSLATLPQHNEGRKALIDELFACGQPEYTAGGKKIFTVVNREELEGLLK